MTPEERAEALLTRAAAEHLSWSAQRDALAAAIRAAVAFERERCLAAVRSVRADAEKVLDSRGDGMVEAAEQIEAAIRDRREG